MSRRDRPSLPPLFPPSPTSSTSNYFDHSSMLPPPRVRTPSFSSGNLFGASNSNRYGAFSVPPPALPSTNATSITSPTTTTTRGTSCVPCKKGHLKCGKGQRPCQMCVKRGRPEECMEGIPPQQAEMFMKLFHQKKTAILGGPTAPFSSIPKTPVFDDEALYPASSSSSYDDSIPLLPPLPGLNSFGSGGSARLSSSSTSARFPSVGQFGSTSLTYPSLGQSEMPVYFPVYLVLGKDFCIGRASREGVRTFGFHSHEMVNQPLPNYLLPSEATKWWTFTEQMFSGGLISRYTPSPIDPVQLAKLPMNELTAPVAKMRSIVETFTFRRRNKDFLPVRIELWFGSYFGANVADRSSFDNAIIVAKVAPLSSNNSLPAGIGGGSFTFPSVLMPALSSSSTSSSSDLPPLDPSRRPSTPGGSLPPLTPLGGSFPPLPPLESLGSSVRKRRGSSTFGDLSLRDAFGHGSGLAHSTRPRLRSPSPMPGHRRSFSSETGNSSSSTSSTFGEYPGLPFPGGPGGLPPFQPLVRPLSRSSGPNRRHYQLDQLPPLEQLPAIPRMMPDSASKPLPRVHHGVPLFPPYPHYNKPRSRSFIAIDRSTEPQQETTPDIYANQFGSR